MSDVCKHQTMTTLLNCEKTTLTDFEDNYFLVSSEGGFLNCCAHVFCITTADISTWHERIIVGLFLTQSIGLFLTLYISFYYFWQICFIFVIHYARKCIRPCPFGWESYKIKETNKIDSASKTNIRVERCEEGRKLKLSWAGDGTLPKHHEKLRVLNEGKPTQWEYYLTHCN